ncbi:MAG: hypothetical protein FP814_10380 [Desulfobacterium sp.]|nr:hypothetical protein [Desulfobacterium sp.]MBU3949630.1 hypothetical protein [Pseudomonadota bacterium]MBU4035288.1 hypothetical protein [Pseudomonadota bacterium]
MNDLDKTLQLRSNVGKIAAVFCVLLSLAIIDTIVAGFRQSKTVFDALPGTSLDINGLTAETVVTTDDIFYTSTSDLISLSIDSIQKGHWFGSKMWQGRFIISPDIKEGEYILVVGIKDIKIKKPPDKFYIRIYKDYESYRKSYKSLIKRYFDISPWYFAAFFFFLIVLTFGCIFLISGKIEILMAGKGKAVIYKVKKVQETCEIFFGLGIDHGVKTSTRINVFNDKGQASGTAVVHSATETDSIAYAESGCVVEPGYMVAVYKG